MQRRGFSLIELVTVLTIFLALSYFALPALDIVQVKSREKLLRQRLFDMRRAIDFYVKARNSSGNPYPPSIASLTEVIPTSLLRNGADTGPFLPVGSIGNPFGKSDDTYVWEIRAANKYLADADCWTTSYQSTDVFPAGVFDVRYPENNIQMSGWSKAIDETFYKDW